MFALGQTLLNLRGPSSDPLSSSAVPVCALSQNVFPTLVNSARENFLILKLEHRRVFFFSGMC